MLGRMSRAVSLVSCVVALSAFGCDDLTGGGSSDRPDGASGSGDEPLFEVAPDTSTCEPGVLSSELKHHVLVSLNALRARHGLLPVRYEPGHDEAVQAAALLFVANARLSHDPSPSAHCYSEDARRGAAASNSILTAGSEVGDVTDPARYLGEWMIDRGVAGLGHRRLLLDPFLEHVAFGMVQGEPLVDDIPYRPVMGAALLVVNEEQPSLLLTDLELVAYPYEDYPAELFALDAALSFSVFASPFGYAPNREVSYERAAIEVRAGGTALPVHSISASTTPEGLPNVVQWRVDGLEHGVRYDVSIDGVVVAGETRSYEYGFTVVNE